MKKQGGRTHVRDPCFLSRCLFCPAMALRPCIPDCSAFLCGLRHHLSGVLQPLTRAAPVVPLDLPGQSFQLLGATYFPTSAVCQYPLGGHGSYTSTQQRPPSSCMYILLFLILTQKFSHYEILSSVLIHFFFRLQINNFLFSPLKNKYKRFIHTNT